MGKADEIQFYASEMLEVLIKTTDEILDIVTNLDRWSLAFRGKDIQGLISELSVQDINDTVEYLLKRNALRNLSPKEKASPFTFKYVEVTSEGRLINYYRNSGLNPQYARIHSVAQMLKRQRRELEEIRACVEEDKNLEVARQRLQLWRKRTTRLISEQANPEDAEKLGAMQSEGTTIKEVEQYHSFLSVLLEELGNHPWNVIFGQIQEFPKGVDMVNQTGHSKSKNPRKVWVVHGRNLRARDAIFDFLGAVGLEPLEWSEAKKLTGKPLPSVPEILETAFSEAQAVIVLFTPDDEARLREPLRGAKEKPHETNLTPQARPNVLFEAGMAMGSHPNRTILIEFGDDLRPFSDVGGLHLIRMDNSSEKRQELLDVLENAECPINRSGTRWHKAGDFDAALEGL